MRTYTNQLNNTNNEKRTFKGERTKSAQTNFRALNVSREILIVLCILR